MNEARSIKQNPLPDALPNFRNLGITLRILLISNAMALITAILLANDGSAVVMQLLQTASLLVPVLLGSLLLLTLIQPALKQLSYGLGVLVVNVLVAAVTLLTVYLGRDVYQPHGSALFDAVRSVLLSVTSCSLLLVYFRLRAQVLSRAVEDARLQVLRARIRPHFLYNTINAVLGIVRSQPKQAETALEDMADLFRMAMADEQDMVPLKKEIQLCKQYLALEQLRMGDRLLVDWQLQGEPEEALIPALLLQPLLENAVYHGIEPMLAGGRIQVLLRRQGVRLQIVVENPSPRTGETRAHAGNKIALQNIRERLALLFDAEASYQVSVGDDYYRVEISLPFLKEQAL